MHCIYRPTVAITPAGLKKKKLIKLSMLARANDPYDLTASLMLIAHLVPPLFFFFFFLFLLVSDKSLRQTLHTITKKKNFTIASGYY